MWAPSTRQLFSTANPPSTNANYAARGNTDQANAAAPAAQTPLQKQRKQQGEAAKRAPNAANDSRAARRPKVKVGRAGCMFATQALSATPRGSATATRCGMRAQWNRHCGGTYPSWTKAVVYMAAGVGWRGRLCCAAHVRCHEFSGSSQGQVQRRSR